MVQERDRSEKELHTELRSCWFQNKLELCYSSPDAQAYYSFLLKFLWNDYPNNQNPSPCRLEHKKHHIHKHAIFKKTKTKNQQHKTTVPLQKFFCICCHFSLVVFKIISETSWYRQIKNGNQARNDRPSWIDIMLPKPEHCLVAETDAGVAERPCRRRLYFLLIIHKWINKKNFLKILMVQQTTKQKLHWHLLL